MNLYKLFQNEIGGYDTYDSCVVVAKSPKEAAKIHPSGAIYGDKSRDGGKFNFWHQDGYNNTWTKDPNKVKVELIGVAHKSLKENTVVVSSFNAG